MIRIESARKIWSEWRIGAWLSGIASALLLSVVVGALFSYATPGSWTLTKSVRERSPFPAVMVGWHTVASFSDIADDLSSVRSFYEKQDFSSMGLRVDFSTEEGKTRLKVREREIINRMLENEVIRRAANREGLSITQEQAEEAVSKELNVEGNDVEGVEDRIASLYGWSLSEFAEKVVHPSLYEEELRKRFASDSSRFVEAKTKVETAKKRLDDGRTFTDVAVELSEGRTAKNGGSMGWFTYDDLDTALQLAARSQKAGVAGNVLESDLGFHILFVNDRKTENGIELVDLSQIFVRKQTFGDWLSEELKTLPVWVLAPEYEWNRDTARVEFRDPELRQFEMNLLQNSEGDASVMF